MTRLGDATRSAAAELAHAGAAQVAATRTPLGEALAGTGAVVKRTVTVPLGAGVPAAMRLLGHDEQVLATVQMAIALRDVDLTIDWLWKDLVEQERARQYMAIALRDPNDPDKPLGTLEDWRHPSITGPVLIRLWLEYADMVQEYDPAGDQLDEVDARGIADAIEKKSAPRLVAFGSAKLASFLLSTAGRPATSPTPKSSPGPAPSDEPSASP